MPKRSSSNDNARPRKKNSTSLAPTVPLRAGEVLTDINGKQWRIGKTVGIGGFGAIFLATDNVRKEADNTSQYVAKVETHSSGPLFVEINCYIRIAKQQMVQEWMEKKSMKKLGMPHYVASGSHTFDDTKFRFLILPQFDKNLEEVFESNGQQFSMKTVLILAIQLLDVIEYIHDNGYVHCDIKASNILLKRSGDVIVKKEKGSIKKKTSSRRSRRRNAQKPSQCESENMFDNKLQNAHEQVYLLDFGLVSKYLQSNGQHKSFCSDERKAHAGTLLFCSLDAHRGVQARRSDLESLGYNLVYWLTSNLPWMKEEDPVLVHKTKQKCLINLHEFFEVCFKKSYPKFLYDYFKYVVQLDFEKKPDYNFCRSLFKKALQNYSYNNQHQQNFEDITLWRKKRELGLKKYNQISYKLNRVPLSSKYFNMPAKPLRRLKDQNGGKLTWSKILTDPEDILKRGNNRERKLTESSDNSSAVFNMNIKELNPTYAMLDVYNNLLDKMELGLSPKRDDDDRYDQIEGYTPAMMLVYRKKIERERFEVERTVASKSRTRRALRTKTIQKLESVPAVVRSTLHVSMKRKDTTKGIVRSSMVLRSRTRRGLKSVTD